MFKNLLVLLLSVFFLFSCSKEKNKEVTISEPTQEEQGQALYAEGVKALEEGDAFYATKKFMQSSL